MFLQCKFDLSGFEQGTVAVSGDGNESLVSTEGMDGIS
jgi:hypothetical protein